MSCVDSTCGVGGFPGPKPGDPDNNLTLRARSAYGGIEVSWTYPSVNPYAVAHVVVYRGPSADFALATERVIVAANSFFDAIEVEVDTEFFYWIKIVSTNGTVMDPIGPTSATARVRRFQTLEELTGLIDNGVLAQSLKTSIAGLTTTNQQVYDEIMARLLANQEFAAALAQVQAGLEQSMTFVSQEIVQRQEGDSALASSIEIIAAANHDNLAAIEEERIARVDADSAMAEDITSLIAKVGDNTAGLVHDVKVVTDAQQATAEDVTRLASTVGDSNSGLLHDMQVISTAVGGLASDITTVETAINGDVATGQVGLVTTISTLNGVVEEIGALYTAKVQVNGLIGGFGVYNNGQTVEAGFDVDRFWVGRTGPDMVKPFIIDSGVVYMDKARIRNADIDTLKIAGEAITVPIISTVPDRQLRGKGEGTMDVVNQLYMNMVQPGMAYILMTSAMGFAKNDRYWQFYLRVNGAILRSIMGRQAESAPVLSAVVPLPAGIAHVEVLWSAHSDVIMGYNDLFMMGVKK